MIWFSLMNLDFFAQKLVILYNSALLVELVVFERREQVAVGVHIRGLGVGEGDGGLKIYVLWTQLNSSQIFFILVMQHYSAQIVRC